MRKLDYIAHHGILGQKWGIRRFQNPDGTLTKAGVKHYQQAEKALKREQKRKKNKRIRRVITLGLALHTVMYVKNPEYRSRVNEGVQQAKKYANDVINSEQVKRAMQYFK